MAHDLPGDGAACSRNLTLALTSEIADFITAGNNVAQLQHSFQMSSFACVMAAWCALRSDNMRMLQMAVSVFAQVAHALVIVMRVCYALSPSFYTCLCSPQLCPASLTACFPLRSHCGGRTTTTRLSRFCSCSVEESKPAMRIQRTEYRPLQLRLSVMRALPSAVAVISTGSCKWVVVNPHFWLNSPSGIWPRTRRWICSTSSDHCSCYRRE